MNTSIPNLNLVFDPFPTLQTERMILRQFEESDAKLLFKMRSDPEVMKYISRPHMRSEAEALQYIKNARNIKNGDYSIEWAMALKTDKKLIGKLSFWRIMHRHFRAELGYNLAASHFGQGYMSEAIESVLRFGFENIQLHSIEANLNPNNLKSEAVLLKNGFIKEGLFKENYFYEGVFYNTLSCSLLKGDWLQQQ